MMKPKGKTEKDEEMLEYIEDIVGTSQYKEPIQLMNAKVEQFAEEEEKQVFMTTFPEYIYIKVNLNVSRILKCINLAKP